MATLKRKPRAKNPPSTIAQAKTPKQLGENDWRYYTEYYNQNFVHKASLDMLADRILEAIENNPSVKTFNKILAICGTDDRTMIGFLKRSEKLRKAKERAMFLLAVRREEMALDRDLDFKTFSHMQGRYDPVWQSQEEYFNKLRQKVAASIKPQSFNVSIPTADQLEGRSNDQELERRREDNSKQVHSEALPDTDPTSS